MARAIGVGGGLIASAHDKKFGYGGHRLITQRKQEKIPKNKKSFTKVFDRRKRERQLGPLIERDRFKPSQPKMERTRISAPNDLPGQVINFLDLGLTRG
ncbi:hypothetical protein RIR_jg3162.t1 [Rhizophagus irregularis DAOM 181602=DAOM 197198]|nr:hypothetical protein RIR_jg3162.t1 [Rhizophagus irregularis DAOM 181602=DAOM 197198]